MWLTRHQDVRRKVPATYCFDITLYGDPGRTRTLNLRTRRSGRSQSGEQGMSLHRGPSGLQPFWQQGDYGCIGWSAPFETRHMTRADTACRTSLKLQAPAEAGQCRDECCDPGRGVAMVLTRNFTGSASQRKYNDFKWMRGARSTSRRIENAGRVIRKVKTEPAQKFLATVHEAV